MALESDEAADIINGIFQINARLVDTSEDVRAIRRLVEEDDDGQGGEDDD